MRYKLVCFDLDGTLVDETIFIWYTLHEFFGSDKEEVRGNIDAFKEGRITYQEWVDSDIRMWKKAGATKEKIFKAIEPLKLMPGALPMLEELKKAGLKLAIVSGSITFVLDKLIPDHEKIFDHVYMNKVVFNKDGTIKQGIGTPFDMEHKATGLKKIAEQEGIPLEQCVFVGDNHNDVHIAEIAGFSIAFNCKSDELAQIADVVIEKKDLREILKYVID